MGQLLVLHAIDLELFSASVRASPLRGVGDLNSGRPEQHYRSGQQQTEAEGEQQTGAPCRKCVHSCPPWWAATALWEEENAGNSTPRCGPEAGEVESALRPVPRAEARRAMRSPPPDNLKLCFCQITQTALLSCRRTLQFIPIYCQALGQSRKKVRFVRV